ncbi:hypothetical protein ACLOJK_030311 [Asimina triloba]
MAAFLSCLPFPFRFLLLLLLSLLLSTSAADSSSFQDFSIIDYDGSYQDYSPPSPPPPPPSPPHPSSISCVDDLKGIGSLNDSCELNTDLELDSDLFVEANGSVQVLQGVSVICAIAGCSVTFNLSGDFTLGENASIVAGLVVVYATNVTLAEGSLISTVALAGSPPAQTSGTPLGIDGAGGGHGGRGACCLKDSKKLPEDVWGGDAYSWSSLQKPCSYGSKGGTTSKEFDYGGGGGGRIWLEVLGDLLANGTISADGGDGGLKGGGGSGGSIYMTAPRM